MTVGAPPDAYNQQGQDWSQPPWRPDRLAETGYAPYRAMLRTVLRHAGGIRVDHILGLFRLWWVPQGRPPTEGAYVRYDPEALVGILRQDRPAHLHRAVAEAMTINETSFFRDVRPFEALRLTVLPRLIEQRQHQRSLRIWSAALVFAICSNE